MERYILFKNKCSVSNYGGDIEHMEHFEKLKEHLPDIAKIVATFPPSLQEKVYNTLVSELLGRESEVPVKDPEQPLTESIKQSQVEGDLSAIATLTPEGQYHSSIRDIKAKNAKDAAKRLVYVLIRSYAKLMNTPSVSRKEIINPELIRWRLADGNSRAIIAKDRGIIKQGDLLSLDQHAQNEADQYIQDINDLGKTGTWKPGMIKKQRRKKTDSENEDEMKLVPPNE